MPSAMRTGARRHADHGRAACRVPGPRRARESLLECAARAL